MNKKAQKIALKQMNGPQREALKDWEEEKIDYWVVILKEEAGEPPIHWGKYRFIKTIYRDELKIYDNYIEMLIPTNSIVKFKIGKDVVLIKETTTIKNEVRGWDNDE